MDETVISPTRAWGAQARIYIRTAWLKQAFRHASDRKDGLRRLLLRRRDFPRRARAVAEAVAKTVPLLVVPGQLSAEEYQAHLRDLIFYQLPFLEPHVREMLARSLVTAYEQAADQSRVKRRGRPKSAGAAATA